MTGFILRKVIRQRDIPYLYKSMTDEEQYLFSVKLSVNSEQEFGDWFTKRLTYDFHDFYMIISEKDGLPIGYAHNYDFSLQNHNCKIVVYITKDYRDTGAGGFGAVQFIRRLFQLYPLKKVYATVYDYNACSLINNQKAGFIEEGVLKKYRYYDGAYHSLHILSIDRQTFSERFGGNFQQ